MRWLLTLTLVCVFSTISVSAQAASYFGSVQTGLQLVEDNEKTKYYVYVPSNFSGEKEWPLILGFAQFGSDMKAYAEAWASLAEERGYIVVCPLWYKAREVPDQVDKWVFTIMGKSFPRYSIDRKRILLTGGQDGGDYAYYLGLRYPRRFSAVALEGGVLPSAFRRMVSYRKFKKNAIPYFSLIPKDGTTFADGFLTLEDVRADIEKLKSKGTDVLYQEVGNWDGKPTPQFNELILNWFESKK